METLAKISSTLVPFITPKNADAAIAAGQCLFAIGLVLLAVVQTLKRRRSSK